MLKPWKLLPRWPFQVKLFLLILWVPRTNYVENYVHISFLGLAALHDIKCQFVRSDGQSLMFINHRISRKFKLQVCILMSKFIFRLEFTKSNKREALDIQSEIKYAILVTVNN